ncbi:MAG: ABC transporter permease [Chloroflexi bacterium]|nr:ABC transporter permease [Chloroflexota bacterium]
MPVDVARILDRMVGNEMLGIAIKRLWSRLALTVLSLLGVALAVALVTCVPVFSRAVSFVVMEQELNALAAISGRPPVSLRFYKLSSFRKPLGAEESVILGQHIADTVSAEVQLPIKRMVVEGETPGLSLATRPDDPNYNPEKFLGEVKIGFLPGIEERMRILDGAPMDQTAVSGEWLDIWVHERLAAKWGLQVGETYDSVAVIQRSRIPVRIAGLWQAADPEDKFWFFNPDFSYQDVLMVRFNDYVTHVEPFLDSKTGFVSWYLVLDDAKLAAEDGRIYAQGLGKAQAIIEKYVPGASMDYSPLAPLDGFLTRESAMSILLFSFSVPVMGFLFYFLSLISTITVNWQQQENSVMISRGMGRGHILRVSFAEGFILLLIGAPLGVWIGLQLARLMGNSLSFMTFVQRAPLPITPQAINITLVAGALLASLLTRIWPSIQVARHSVITYEQERSRPTRAPFWQRFYLDILLIIPTWYGYRQLANRGTLGQLSGAFGNDPFQDPILFLAPTFFVLTASLLTVRLFPIAMRVLDWLCTLLPFPTLYMAFRQLSRQSGQYVSALLLVIASLSLGGYMASMAASLDQWLIDRVYYEIGADLAFTQSTVPPDSEQTSSGDLSQGSWLLPIEDYLDLPGVASATRVGDYLTTVSTAGGRRSIRGRFLGIDRLDFTKVAAFRSDYARAPLGELMNRLAMRPDGILISQSMLDQYQLQIGDTLSLRTTVENLSFEMQHTIVGVYDVFPTVYEAERPTVVGNLDNLFTAAGSPLPHSIWFRLLPGADQDELYAKIEGLGVWIAKWRNTGPLITLEQNKMERVGIFGMLTLSFLAAALFAGIGLLVYNYASLRERLYRFAIVRAVGLTQTQLLTQVALEYGVLTGYGVVGGVGIGVLVSHLFIPFFRVTTELDVRPPSLMPLIAWEGIAQITVAFVAALLLAQLAVIILTTRRGVFQALRMGDQE